LQFNIKNHKEYLLAKYINIIKMLDASIILKIEPEESETEEAFEDFNMRLISELKEVQGVSDVSFNNIHEKAPEGTRAGELIPMGEMVMTFLTTGGIAASMDVLKLWIGGRKKRIKIDTKNGILEADNLSNAEIDKVLNLVNDKKL
jgi:hypothetical protein